MMTDNTMELRKLLASSKLIATGITNNADTRSAPTILMAVLTTRAVRTVMIMFIHLTGRPLTLAASSSKLSRKNS